MGKTVKLMTESVKNQIVNTVVKLVCEHQLTVTNLEDIIHEVTKYMLDNAVIDRD